MVNWESTRLPVSVLAPSKSRSVVRDVTVSNNRPILLYNHGECWSLPRNHRAIYRHTGTRWTPRLLPARWGPCLYSTNHDQLFTGIFWQPVVVIWPPHSPDLTSLDFFLWGHLKTKMFQIQGPDLPTFCTQINKEIQKVLPLTLHRVFHNLKRCAIICKNNLDTQFQHSM